MKSLFFVLLPVFLVPQSHAQASEVPITSGSTDSTAQVQKSAGGIAARVANHGRSSISVRDFGAAGDIQTDDTAAFQKALQVCAAQGGGRVEVPQGTYHIGGNLHIPANVALRGTFVSAFSGKAAQIMSGHLGSALLAYAGRGIPAGAPFITLDGQNSALDGFAIYYPEANIATVPPVPYPPTVATDNTSGGPKDNISVQNCLFLNSYDAIRLIHAGLHLIRNVTGYPIHRGIYVDEITGVGRIENVHFRPFDHKYTTTDPYSQWINREGVAIEFGRTDWEILSNCFSFGYGIGIRFSASPIDGIASCGKLIGCGVDCADRPLEFLACVSHWQISDGEFVGRWASHGTTAVDIGPDAKGRISFSNCAFWGPIARVITMRAPDGIVSLEGCQIQTWNDNAGAIDIQAGRAILQGNSFDRVGTRHLVVEDGAGPVIATGNLAAPRFDVRAAPGTHVILSANQ